MHLDLLGNPSSGGNCYLLSTGSQTMMLDAGLAWSSERDLGVDFTVPKLMEEQAREISLIAITHSHEDHIGALPYILRALPAIPRIVAGPVTSAIVRQRLGEAHVGARVDSLADYEWGSEGPFRFQMVPVPHSASESMALYIQANGKSILYSGDLRGSDETGYGRLPSKALTQHSPLDILLLEAVRADVDEPDPTLADLKEGLLSAFHRLTGRRIIVSAFASNLSRLQIVIELAQAVGRHVYLLGRSMQNAVRTAQDFRRMPEHSWSVGPPPREATDAKTLILVAGAQGEPDAGLSRLIRGHYPVQARRGDGLIMSSTPIPGNEEAFWSLVEMAMTKGVEVITYRDYLVHLSGHSTASELQRIIRLVKPRWVIPFHGDYFRHAMMRQLGQSIGLSPDRFIPASNGDRILLDGPRPDIQHMNWEVDAYQLGKGRSRSAVKLEPAVLAERRKMLLSGLVVVQGRAANRQIRCIDCTPEVEAVVETVRQSPRSEVSSLQTRLEAAFPTPPALVHVA